MYSIVRSVTFRAATSFVSWPEESARVSDILRKRSIACALNIRAREVFQVD